ncbi:hypothetical protein SLEP1_g19923 [Rubroshorea leprosula]|uniref:Uncharacterized protein n=1 Tax=Rubroshorea leprosula TaxID=152421 RepID=A0AAV5J6Z1_9ROSI|nr:hypothetical protein SLEP1_g19923 [Rubroshorea leprosula]
MVMAENEAGDDQKEVKSPWKTPVIDGDKAADASVMGTESWPALADSHNRSNTPPAASDAPTAIPTTGQIFNLYFGVLYSFVSLFI